VRRLRIPGPVRSRARAEADRLRNGNRPCGCAYDPVVFGHTGCELAGGAQREWPGPASWQMAAELTLMAGPR